MGFLSAFDYSVIVVYFLILVGLGFYLQRKASASLEDYFLGGRKLPWWALGISGMASFLDITGTMIITSFLFMLGPRGMYIEFRGGAVLVLIPMMLWAGKWHRRSGCMTGAEWMIYRFGNGPGGHAARIIKAIAEVAFTVGMLAYLVKGVGLFLSMFLPLTPLQCSLIMIGVATLYTMASGFYGVVFTDLFQSGVILVGVILISIMAFFKTGDAATLSTLAEQVTGRTDWLSTLPPAQMNMPDGYEMYNSFSMFALFYLLRALFDGAGTGDDPKYFGARSDSECGKLSFLWTWLMMFRWPMMIGFAVLGLVLMGNMFPDQTVLGQAAEVIRQHVGDVGQNRWADVVANMIHHAEAYPPELITRLQELLGSDWADKLQMVSYHGTVDPERILPAVLLHMIPRGLRGLLLVVLLAASMSTFDSTVNKTIAYFTRDIYQTYIRPHAPNRELIYVSWGFGIAMVVLGFLLGYTAKNINDIWGWLIAGLRSALLVPFILRLYWWRFNGAGFATGVGVGLIAAFAQRALVQQGIWQPMNEFEQFLFVLIVGLVGTVAGTYLSKPTDDKILEHFYKTTRPFGLWGHLKKAVSPDLRQAMNTEHRRDLLAIPFALGWHITLFLLPMQLIIHAYKSFFITLVIFVVSLAGLIWFWLRHLSEEKTVETPA